MRSIPQYVAGHVLGDRARITREANEAGLLARFERRGRVPCGNRREILVRQRRSLGITRAAQEDGNESLAVGSAAGKEARAPDRSEDSAALLRDDEVAEAVKRAG